MSNNYLFKLNIPNESPQKCSDGCPTNKFPPTTTNLYNNPDILYSVYEIYQSSFTPKYISNNLLYLTNPDNFSGLPPGPSNIFIIRHGEKNKNTSTNTYYTINCNGIYRSVNLPTFINSLGTSGYPITAIVTSNPNMDYPSAHGDLSIRPQTTIGISSWLLDIPLYIFSNQDVSQPYDATTAINLFINPYLKGKNILLVWSHDNIQGLTNQIVQIYNYIKNGGNIQSLYNSGISTYNSTLFNVSTESWWQQNTPVPASSQYPGNQDSSVQGTTQQGLVPNQGTPQYLIPYAGYCQYLPYWNTNTFDKVYWLSQTNKANSLTISIFDQNIYTCFTNCNLLVGAIQYANTPPTGDSNWTNKYNNESNCVPPK
jgi:hypothetical protein